MRDIDIDRTSGYKTVSRFIGAHNTSTDPRAENDYYATHPSAAEFLIDIEHLNHNIWECACGEGHLAKVFTAHGYDVKATDLIDRGYGEGGWTFWNVLHLIPEISLQTHRINLRKTL